MEVKGWQSDKTMKSKPQLTIRKQQLSSKRMLWPNSVNTPASRHQSRAWSLRCDPVFSMVRVHLQPAPAHIGKHNTPLGCTGLFLILYGRWWLISDLNSQQFIPPLTTFAKVMYGCSAAVHRLRCESVAEHYVHCWTVLQNRHYRSLCTSPRAIDHEIHAMKDFFTILEQVQNWR